jgi:hypothetical protein
MKSYLWSAVALLVLSLSCWGCASGLDGAENADTLPLTLRNDPDYVKRVGLGVLDAPSTPLGRESANRFAQAIAETLQGQISRLTLLKAWEEETVREAIDLLRANPIEEAAGRWRADGFQGIATAALLDLRLVSEKTGIFWFRKERYFIKFEVMLDLYDPHSGAKLVNEVSERSLKISQKEYEALQAGTELHLAALDASLTDLADQYGQAAAKALRSHPWQTSVIVSDAEGIVLASGRSSGLQVGDRLVIYGGNKRIAGANGTYVLPGTKITEIEIKQVSEHRSTAAALQIGSIQTGDIAVPRERTP